MADFWAPTGAIWRDMLHAEALVLFLFVFLVPVFLSTHYHVICKEFAVSE